MEKEEIKPDLKKLVEEGLQKMEDKIVTQLTGRIEKSFDKSMQVVVTKSEEEKLLAKGGTNDEAHFYHLVKQAANGTVDALLSKYEAAVKAVSGMSTASPDGGFLIPVEYANTLNERSLAQEIVRPRALGIPISNSMVKVPGLNDYDRTDAAKGGNLGQVVPEGSAASAVSKLAFEQITLQPVKIIVDVTTTPELEEDSPQSIPALVSRLVPARMAQKLDNYFLRTGNGTGMPLGAFSTLNPALYTVAKVGGQTRSTEPIRLANLVSMYERLKSTNGACWVASPGLLSWLLSLGGTYFLPWSTGGTGRDGALVGAPPMTLLGLPIYFNGKMAAAGTVGDIGLADFSQYMVAQRDGMRTATSIHAYWSTDQYAYRFVVRVDGKPGWTATEKLENSFEVSPFVILAGD